MKRVIKLHTFGDKILELDRQITPTHLSDKPLIRYDENRRECGSFRNISTGLSSDLLAFVNKLFYKMLLELGNFYK